MKRFSVSISAVVSRISLVPILLSISKNQFFAYEIGIAHNETVRLNWLLAYLPSMFLAMQIER